MAAADRSKKPQDPAPYKPKILPTRTVNRGFIPERRKRSEDDSGRSSS